MRKYTAKEFHLESNNEAVTIKAKIEGPRKGMGEANPEGVASAGTHLVGGMRRQGNISGPQSGCRSGCGGPLETQAPLLASPHASRHTVWPSPPV